jgi:23S rRNA (adenine2030-N6)-methyltransferase
MNYRHAFHAGNAADVLKHAVLAASIRHLLGKDTPFRYLDTHAGAGVYDLSGEEALRTGEWQSGIGRLAATRLDEAAEAVLAPYRQVVAALNPDGELQAYPGSPELVRLLARPVDRLTLVEKRPDEAARLGARYARDRRVTAIELDGWTALNAYVPPPERRGVVLVDPPFEQPGEFFRLRDGLVRAHRKWPTGTYLLWYPIKDVMDAEAFARDIAATGIPKVLRAELLVRRPQDTARLNGSGMIVVNPAWTLERDLGVLLPQLAALLADGAGARGRVQLLTGG